MNRLTGQITTAGPVHTGPAAPVQVWEHCDTAYGLVGAGVEVDETIWPLEGEPPVGGVPTYS